MRHRMTITTMMTTMAAMTPGEILFFFFLVIFFVARVTRGDALASERRDKPIRRTWLIMLIAIVVCAMAMERLPAKEDRSWRRRIERKEKSNLHVGGNQAIWQSTAGIVCKQASKGSWGRMDVIGHFSWLPASGRPRFRYSHGGALMAMAESSGP